MRAMSSHLNKKPTCRKSSIGIVGKEFGWDASLAVSLPLFATGLDLLSRLTFFEDRVSSGSKSNGKGTTFSPDGASLSRDTVTHLLTVLGFVQGVCSVSAPTSGR